MVTPSRTLPTSLALLNNFFNNMTLFARILLQALSQVRIMVEKDSNRQIWIDTRILLSYSHHYFTLLLLSCKRVKICHNKPSIKKKHIIYFKDTFTPKQTMCF